LDSHKQRATHLQSKTRQKPLSECSDPPLHSAVTSDLVLAFLKEGIPLNKLEKGPLKDFFEKHAGMYVPNVTTLRRSVPKLCEDKISSIRNDIGTSNIWLSV